MFGKSSNWASCVDHELQEKKFKIVVSLTTDPNNKMPEKNKYKDELGNVQIKKMVGKKVKKWALLYSF